jgi:hypothetical protein
MATQLIKFTNDRAYADMKGILGGNYWIEFKDERGFNDRAVTGEELAIGKGIIVQYRPAWPLAAVSGSVQTLVAGMWPVIKEGKTWLLDEHTGLTIEVTRVTDTYADINMWWK